MAGNRKSQRIEPSFQGSAGRSDDDFHVGAGDRVAAAEYYRATLAINPKEDYASDGLARLAAFERGDAQVALHFGDEAE